MFKINGLDDTKQDPEVTPEDKTPAQSVPDMLRCIPQHAVKPTPLQENVTTSTIRTRK